MFVGTLALDDGTVLGASQDGLTGGFVIHLDRTGALTWSKILSLGGQLCDGATLVSVTAWPDGSVAVAGMDDFILDLGEGPLCPTGCKHTGFAGRYDASGQLVWHRQLEAQVIDLAVDADGSLLLLGGSDGIGAPFLRLDASGNTLSKVELSPPEGTGAPSTMALGSSGSVLMGGTTPSRVFAFELDASAKKVWGHGFDGSCTAGLPALGPDGSPFLAGSFTGTLDFGTGAMKVKPTTMPGYTQENGYVVTLRPGG